MFLVTQAAEKESQWKEEGEKQRKFEPKTKGKSDFKGKGREGKDQRASLKRKAPGNAFEEDANSVKRVKGCHGQKLARF